MRREDNKIKMGRHLNLSNSGTRLHRVGKTKKMSMSSAEPRTGTRSKNGCLTCRARHVKCDERHPVCLKCVKQKAGCEWPPPPELQTHQPEEDIPQAESRSLRRLAPAVNDTHDQLIQAQASTWTPDVDLSMSDLPIVPDFSFLTGLGCSDFMPWFPVPYPEPTLDMHISSEALLAPLPLGVSPSQAEREALAWYRSSATFGFGSAKNPNWSTHAIVWETARESKAVLHLLLAATQNEMAWRAGSQGALFARADENYRLGHQQLEAEIRSREIDPLNAMSCFWFLYLHQKRRHAAGNRMLMSELSKMMEEYLTAFNLHQMLTSADAENPAWPEPKKALLARLMVWLFWIDAQAATQGEGGRISRLLTSSASRQALVDLYKISRTTLESFWAGRYPDDEVVDDMKNSSALDMIHDTWVLVQEVNNAADEQLPLDPKASDEILSKIQALQCEPGPLRVLRLTSSNAALRDRVMLNADWAGVNFYTLRIYHFRCSLTEEHLAFSSPQSQTVKIADVVDSLLLLIQKSLATGREDQPDRMQWPLFWAGIETTDPFKRIWALGELKDEGLVQAMRCVLLLQEGGSRVGMAKIRDIFQASCLGVPVAGFGGMWGMRG
ncbi:hypothetical protein QC762_204260 [Podospora pseudocomata]|uniref:Zn(2)-C6 fungal-type domain-containing protein n=1 Tax=Podospora pseudocomata TaxID=2093779 RepID=A0ABR0GQW6_9PEZI|nr:hypothetical protein QC762_204260 [Podospora pseudocomata]